MDRQRETEAGLAQRGERRDLHCPARQRQALLPGVDPVQPRIAVHRVTLQRVGKPGVGRRILGVSRRRPAEQVAGPVCVPLGAAAVMVGAKEAEFAGRQGKAIASARPQQVRRDDLAIDRDRDLQQQRFRHRNFGVAGVSILMRPKHGVLRQVLQI